MKRITVLLLILSILTAKLSRAQNCPNNPTYLNQGPFVNGTSGFVQGTSFTNNNKITGGGNFYFSGKR